MHPLIAAVIDTMPSAGPWPAERREAFFTLLRNALDVSHGKADGAAALVHGAGPAIGAMVSPAAYGMSTSAPPPDDRRFYITPDSYVMCGNRGAKFASVPPGTVIWDERIAPDRGYSTDSSPEWGRTDNILWDDIGTRPDGALPPGVVVRQAASVALAGLALSACEQEDGA